MNTKENKNNTNTVTCDNCNGSGTIDALISMHDDKKETICCGTCNGKGVIRQMTEKEEQDYWDNYW